MFISYACNFEDVMLWRALKNVNNGFYIDIGAQDPVIDSVSLAFYERGWRGIHIEPVPRYADSLRQARPDEIVLQAAIGASDSVINFFEIPETGLSTGNAEIAEKHKGTGFNIKEIQVPCVKLASVLNRYSDREIQWLKIDVEGMEKCVIESWGASASRPWILVVEAVLPLENIPCYEEWEPAVRALGYNFVYFDGVNRFYVSKDHPELNAAFLAGPNVFDDFALSGSAVYCRLLHERYGRELDDLRQEFERKSVALQQDIEGLTRMKESLLKSLEVTQEELRQAQEERAAQERIAMENSARSREEIEGLLRNLAEREREFNEQLILKMQDFEREKEIQAKTYADNCRLLRERYGRELNDLRKETDRQSAALQKDITHLTSVKESLLKTLEDTQEELRRAQQERTAQEKTIEENNTQARDKIEGLLRILEQREKEYKKQLTTKIQEFEREKEKQAKIYEEMEQRNSRNAVESQRRQESILAQNDHLIGDLQGKLHESEQRVNSLCAERALTYEEMLKLTSKVTEQISRQEKLLKSLSLKERESAEMGRLIEKFEQRDRQRSEQISHLKNAAQEEKTRHGQDLQNAIDQLKQLRGSIESEKNLNDQLQQALAQIQQNLGRIRGTFATRLDTLLHWATRFSNEKRMKLSPNKVNLGCSFSFPDINEKDPGFHNVLTSSNTKTELDELLTLQDEAFVHRAYDTLLRRQPDGEGLKHYVARLRAGVSKAAVLYEIRYSKEGRIFPEGMPRLDAFLRGNKIRRIPIIGRFAEVFAKIEGDSEAEQRLRVLENQIYLLGEEFSQQIGKAEQVFTVLAKLLPSADCDVAISSEDHIAVIEKSESLDKTILTIFSSIKRAILTTREGINENCN